MKTETHLFKVDLGSFYLMRDTIIYHIERQLKTDNINYDHYTIENFYKHDPHAVFVVRVFFEGDKKHEVIKKFSLTEIMKKANHGDVCYIDYPSYYNFFETEEDFFDFTYNSKTVNFVPTTMSKPYYHLVRKNH